jgi:hypothetical protein
MSYDTDRIIRYTHLRIQRIRYMVIVYAYVNNTVRVSVEIVPESLSYVVLMQQLTNSME